MWNEQNCTFPRLWSFWFCSSCSSLSQSCLLLPAYKFIHLYKSLPVFSLLLVTSRREGSKGRFTRYDFDAYNKLTTGLRHDLGPTRQFYFFEYARSKSSPIRKLRSKTTNVVVVWVKKSCANNAQLTNGLTHQSFFNGPDSVTWSSTNKHYPLDMWKWHALRLSNQRQFFSELPSPGRSHNLNLRWINWKCLCSCSYHHLCLFLGCFIHGVPVVMATKRVILGKHKQFINSI